MSAVLLLLVAAWFVQSAATSPGFQWDVVGRYFTSAQVLNGLVTTLEITALAMMFGIVLGTLLAVMRLADNHILSSAVALYVWLFRGTPVLVQLIFWYNLASLYPNLTLGLPFGPELVVVDSNTVITGFVAVILALGLHEAAYMAEIVRGGVLSVEQGQTDAAKGLGFNSVQTLRRIILPQAMRVIIPPTGNEVIGMLKTSSLASVVALPELLQATQIIYNRTFEPIPLLIVASIWYLIVTSALTIGQHYVERRFARGAARELPPTPLMRLRARLTSLRTASRR